MNSTARKVLEAVRDGSMTVDEALLSLKTEPFEELGYAKIDHHRAIRQGVPEVIYGAGKTPEQIAGITRHMQEHGQKQILITRITEEAAQEVRDLLSGTVISDESGVPSAAAAQTGQESGGKNLLRYYKQAHLLLVGDMPKPDGKGKILVATGGTSDIPVAEEAALTAEIYGNEVVRLYDVGVAGIHRLLSHSEDVMKASVIIAVAGMEGALASVIGGLADCPVIAVPTSVGYGASFQGLSALLSMLNSCASGVGVVNIDNGFGAGYLASMINHQ